MTLGQLYTKNKLNDCIETLIDIAYKNCVLRYKHAACLIKGKKVYSFGINQCVYNKVLQVSVHAEIDALCKLSSKLLKGMDILIIRIGKSSELRNSRPCNSCIDKLQRYGIRKVFYSNDQGDIVYEFVDSMPKIYTSSGYRYKL